MSGSARPPRRPALPSRLLGIGAKGAERVATATGIDDAMQTATEEAIVRALESPAVERAIVRVLESDEAQAAFERTLSSPAVERAAVQVLDSPLVDHVWDRLLASDEAQKLIERIAEAPELRAAIAAQGVGLLRDIGRQVRDIAMRFDDGLERLFRRVIGRPRREPTNHVGPDHAQPRDAAGRRDPERDLPRRRGARGLRRLGARATRRASRPFGVVFGLGSWILFGSLYLLTFWAAAGQTPGMRLLSIRIEDHDGSPRLGFRSARRRLVGLVLALIPFGLGLLGVLTHDDRRGLLGPPRRHGRDPGSTR